MTQTENPSTGKRISAAAPAKPYSRILGIGSYRPSRVVSNEEMCTIIDSTPDWIQQRTGITERRWATEDETVKVMSLGAARQAIERSGIAPEQIEAVIVATVSHMHQTPGIAPTIATELGAEGAAAYDVSAACAGFCYALAQADGLVRVAAAEHVLVIGVERLSQLTNFEDRSTAFLFADGAGAAVVGPSDTPGIGPVVWGSSGSQADVIGQTQAWDEYSGGPQPKLYMEGQKVFRWASTTVAKKTVEMLDRAGLTTDDLDLFIPHQANNRITDAMIRTLRLPEHITVARDIITQGNASAASIPLAVERLYENGQARSGQLALIVGFGAGLVFAGQIIEMP